MLQGVLIQNQWSKKYDYKLVLPLFGCGFTMIQRKQQYLLIFFIDLHLIFGLEFDETILEYQQDDPKLIDSKFFYLILL